MPLDQFPDSFGFLIADVSRLARAEFDRRISEAGLGLTPGEARALSNAFRAGVVRQTVLADRMGVEAMTLSAYLDRLEARGLIERRPDPTDRRAKLVYLADSARAVLETIQAVGDSIKDDLVQTISPSEWEHLNAALRLTRDSLNQLRLEAIRRESDAA
ncbi:MAG: MarR family transcriptional regulator [Mesorhizobium sp.]|nr:MarR family transcriptional regulator [Mesorhizobium sp.]MCO5161949.1 MarR family transcriptional regulator [Mesorhizobium sp.]